jgi:hypothetical protein
MKLPAAPQAGSPLCSDKLRGILAKANKHYVNSPGSQTFLAAITRFSFSDTSRG